MIAESLPCQMMPTNIMDEAATNSQESKSQANAPATSMPRFGSRAQTQTEKVTADSLSAGWEKRTVQEALDEVARELGVRERIYGKWVAESKHSKSDASDRLQRMIKAAAILQAIANDAGLCNVIQTQLDSAT